MSHSRAFAAYSDFLESLSADRLDRLADHVAPTVRFADPFHDTEGIAAMRAVFARTFAQLGALEIVIKSRALAGDTGFLHWTFSADLRGRPWQVDGVTLVRFDAESRVVQHLEYWDAAGQFYERLPGLGAVLRIIRRRIAGATGRQSIF